MDWQLLLSNVSVGVVVGVTTGVIVLFIEYGYFQRKRFGLRRGQENSNRELGPSNVNQVEGESTQTVPTILEESQTYETQLSHISAPLGFSRQKVVRALRGFFYTFALAIIGFAFIWVAWTLLAPNSFFTAILASLGITYATLHAILELVTRRRE